MRGFRYQSVKGSKRLPRTKFHWFAVANQPQGSTCSLVAFKTMLMGLEKGKVVNIFQHPLIA